MFTKAHNMTTKCARWNRNDWKTERYPQKVQNDHEETNTDQEDVENEHKRCKITLNEHKITRQKTETNF